MKDWRLPENRREGFHRFYTFQLKYRAHPGCVHALLPFIADAFKLDEDQRAWLVWLNGNTENAVTSLMLLEVAPTPREWAAAVAFWNVNFKKLEWDTDRRHQKSKFGEATERWFMEYGHKPARQWFQAGARGWDDTWRFATNQPYMGRMSSWSMIEYARILLGSDIPDADTLMLGDMSGSRSHRNGLAVVAGYDAAHWDADIPFILGIEPELEHLGEDLLDEAIERNSGAPWERDVNRLSLESALCTYKSHYKPNRRYANVYSDMMYNRIRKAETRFSRTFDMLWDARQVHLPITRLRLEDTPHDPGLASVKQNHFLETGQHVMIGYEFADMWSDFDEKVSHKEFDRRKDPKWTS